MTFLINGVDFSNYIQVYGYATSYLPVFGQSVMTLDGVEHTAVLRYRGSVSINLKPLTSAEWNTLSTALSTGILRITYFCIQRNRDVVASMKLDRMSAELVLKNASRMLYGNTQLIFQEL